MNDRARRGWQAFERSSDPARDVKTPAHPTAISTVPPVSGVRDVDRDRLNAKIEGLVAEAGERVRRTTNPNTRLDVGGAILSISIQDAVKNLPIMDQRELRDFMAKVRAANNLPYTPRVRMLLTLIFQQNRGIKLPSRIKPPYPFNAVVEELDLNVNTLVAKIIPENRSIPSHNVTVSLRDILLENLTSSVFPQ